MKASRSSTHKRVVVRKTDKELVKGFVDPSSSLGAEGIEVLDRQGRLVSIPLEQIKAVFFVREFEGNPQRQERKVFHSRPRLAGLWVRMTFKDHEVLEGIVANNLLEIEPLGFWVTPPDLYSNNLRIFVPRSSLNGIEVLGVISDGAARRATRRQVPAEAGKQITLFTPNNPPTNR